CSTDEPATPPAARAEDLDGDWSIATSAKTAQATQTFEDEEEFVQPWSPEFDEAEIEVALEPVLKEMLGQD
ncbi:unnamed protein product, partial [Cladocopium goreaui]